jgi:preprotein translocase subunit SecG
MFFGLILGIHVLICVVLCITVLLQSSKGSGLAGGGAFGGGAESTIFGGRGAATFLSKATTIFGVAFMVTSLTLTLLGKSTGGRPRSAVAEEARSNVTAPTETAPPGMPVPGPEGALPPVDGAVPVPPEGSTPTPEGGSEGAAQPPAPTTPNGG